MNYIEKVFKQYPFLYFINNSYYVFGTGSCYKANEKLYGIQNRHYLYLNNLNEELSQEEARKIFKKVVGASKSIRDKIGIETNPLKKFNDFHFNEEEIKELEKQCKQYIDFFRKYHLDDFEY